MDILAITVACVTADLFDPPKMALCVVEQLGQKSR